MDTITDSAVLRLLQFSSAALPVGGYSFSLGMESAVEQGWLPDVGATRSWLSLQLHQSLALVDIPLLQRQMQCAMEADVEQLRYWNAYLLASRETAELRLSETATGEALFKLLRQFEVPLSDQAIDGPGFITGFALAGAYFELPWRALASGYVWTWLENQVSAATKLVPLGQSAAQQLLGELMVEVPDAIDRGEALDDAEIGASLPGLAMASAWHETQYSRLFRS
jgi:urease accessory protein